MTQYGDKVWAVFRPVRLDDLRPKAKQAVGGTYKFRAIEVDGIRMWEPIVPGCQFFGCVPGKDLEVIRDASGARKRSAHTNR